MTQIIEILEYKPEYLEAHPEIPDSTDYPTHTTYRRSLQAYTRVSEQPSLLPAG